MSSSFPEEHAEDNVEESISAEQPFSVSEEASVVVESDTQATAEPPSSEALLPPEAQGEPNGGPLGCCLGVVVGIFLTALIITSLSVTLANGGFLSFTTIPFFILGAILGGYVGWRIGKRIYKEYEPPVVKERPYSKKPGVKTKPRRVL